MGTADRTDSLETKNEAVYFFPRMYLLERCPPGFGAATAVPGRRRYMVHRLWFLGKKCAPIR